MNTVRQIADELQQLYSNELPTLVSEGKHLIESLPQKRPPIAQLVFSASIGRIWTLFQDACDSFNDRLGYGYFATAAISRVMMENATLILYFNKNQSIEDLSAYLAKQECEAMRRHKGLAAMRSNPDKKAALDASHATTQAAKVIDSLKDLRRKANLPVTAKKFPDMLERCKLLGASWEFLYHETYRELCEAVHGSFNKIPFTPSLAFNSRNQGDALIAEHCRAFSYAVEFWAVVVLDSCRSHSKKQDFDQFNSGCSQIFGKELKLSDALQAVCDVHSIRF